MTTGAQLGLATQQLLAYAENENASFTQMCLYDQMKLENKLSQVGVGGWTTLDLDEAEFMTT